MTRMNPMVLGLLLLVVASAARSVPPLPVRLPEELARPINGYDLSSPYELWRSWIEYRKGAATEAVLAKPDSISGEVVAGPPLLRFRKYNDFGHFLTGEIQAFCRPKSPYGFVSGTCHYRLRRAYVPYEAAPFDTDNPVSRWMRKSFDASKLTAHFRASGIPTDQANSDWFRHDRATLFSVLPDPITMLVENATLISLDSRECPAMAAALEALDRERLPGRLDFKAVGEDEQADHPWPHSVYADYRLQVTSANSSVSIEGMGRSFDRMIGPVLDAADGCERARPEVES